MTTVRSEEDLIKMKETLEYRYQAADGKGNIAAAKLLSQRLRVLDWVLGYDNRSLDLTEEQLELFQELR